MSAGSGKEGGQQNYSRFLYLVILNTEFCKGPRANMYQIVGYHLTKLSDQGVGGVLS